MLEAQRVVCCACVPSKVYNRTTALRAHTRAHTHTHAHTHTRAHRGIGVFVEGFVCRDFELMSILQPKYCMAHLATSYAGQPRFEEEGVVRMATISSFSLKPRSHGSERQIRRFHGFHHRTEITARSTDHAMRSRTIRHSMEEVTHRSTNTQMLTPIRITCFSGAFSSPWKTSNEMYR